MTQRCGRNHGAYHGECVDIDAVLGRLHAVATARGFTAENFLSESPGPLTGFHRAVPTPCRRVYLSAGIHGDEPAGPLALAQLIEEDRWPTDAAVWLCPCLNPAGFRRGRRENPEGIDLNRDYRHRTTAEVRSHVAWLDRQPRFDLAICLHEDWEAHGFYLYELNPAGRPSPAPAVLEAVSAVCPIDLSPEIDGRAAHGGIIRPSLDPASRPQWPEAFYLIQHRTIHSLTLEAPSDFPLRTRVAALVHAARAACARP